MGMRLRFVFGIHNHLSFRCSHALCSDQPASANSLHPRDSAHSRASFQALFMPIAMISLGFVGPQLRLIASGSESSSTRGCAHNHLGHTQFVSGKPIHGSAAAATRAIASTMSTAYRTEVTVIPPTGYWPRWPL